MTKRKDVPSAKAALAANVKRLREAMGLSQEKLAEQAGFHRTYVSQVERGLANITLDNLDRLADELHVAAFVLIRHGNARDPSPPER
jgi:transcriptional regulator with XRE-family HTH domain